MHEQRLLKNTNPKAYEELIEFYPEYGINMYKKETIPADSNMYFGEWKCPSGKHTYITTIAYREDENNDPGCPICKNNNKNINPRLFSMRNRYNGKRNVHESLWYCNKCKYMSWHSDNYNTYIIDHHFCFENTIFSHEYPDIAIDWSSNNFVSSDEISYNPDLDYKFEWNCNVCGMKYQTDMRKKVRLKEKACPYCQGKIENYKRPILALYPNLSDFWIDELNNYALNLICEDDNKKRYLRCSKCGVVKFDIINDFINGECIFCNIGITKEESRRIYRETGVNSEKEYLNPAQVTPQWWICEECNNQYFLSPKERFFKVSGCPYCTGKYAIPGKTSFKALYPEIERQLILEESDTIDTDKILPTYKSERKYKWKCQKCNCIWKATIAERVEGKECIYCNKSLYQLYKNLIDNEWIWKNNILLANPRYLFPMSTKKVWWKCSICNRTYKYSIYERIKDYKRNRNSCIYCRGKIKIIRRN